MAEQQKCKADELAALFAEADISHPVIEVLSTGPGGLRDRSDLIIENGALGFYRKDRREILDIGSCPLFSPALAAWYAEFRKIRWPIRKGSVRLRVGPGGERGVWLDFANIDIKNLLLERTLLAGLQELAFVEIGQKRKHPELVNGVYKLREPVLHPWFQTWIGDQAVDLYCQVASFTQPSLAANRLLVSTIEKWLEQTGANHILEFGSGIGNLSFPALGRNRRLTACEIDACALEGFRRSLEVLAGKPKFQDFGSRVNLQAGDFQNKARAEFGDYDTVLVNPPRSGLRKFLDPLIEGEKKPKYFIYMSCFPESFLEDAARLKTCGYGILDVKIVDQFPQTPHYEVLSLWGR